MTAPLAKGDEVEWLDTETWRPGTVIGVRYVVTTGNGEVQLIDAEDVRHAPRLPFGEVR